VEDRIDRLPMRDRDPEATVNALDDLKCTLRLMDGWRNTYPTDKNWTYRQQNENGSKSRIDRIYVTQKVFRTAREWRIEPCHISDHSFALVQVVDEKAPEVGTGRRTFAKYLLKDKIMKGIIQKLAMKLEDAIAKITPKLRTETNNAQTLLHEFKKDVMAAAKLREGQIVPKTLEKL
ncbi:hypothetical protein CPC08DRAFT_613899, partial [Agrocybe pediades]